MPTPSVYERVAEERDELKAMLIEANGLCRSAFQIANRIATELGTNALGTHFGHFAERLNQSLKRQHDCIQKHGGYPVPAAAQDNDQ